MGLDGGGVVGRRHTASPHLYEQLCSSAAAPHCQPSLKTNTDVAHALRDAAVMHESITACSNAACMRDAAVMQDAPHTQTHRDAAVMQHAPHTLHERRCINAGRSTYTQTHRQALRDRTARVTHGMHALCWCLCGWIPGPIQADMLSKTQLNSGRTRLRLLLPPLAAADIYTSTHI